MKSYFKLKWSIDFNEQKHENVLRDFVRLNMSLIVFIFIYFTPYYFIFEQFYSIFYFLFLFLVLNIIKYWSHVCFVRNIEQRHLNAARFRGRAGLDPTGPGRAANQNTSLEEWVRSEHGRGDVGQFTTIK